MLKDFSLSRPRFMLEPEWRLALHPRNPGNTLRGAFQLHVQATGLPDSSRLPRYLPPENHLSVRPDLRTESAAGNRPPPPESGYSSPFVFRPPSASDLEADSGTAALSFELTLIGSATDYFPYFLVTFRELGQQGIGIG